MTNATATPDGPTGDTPSLAEIASLISGMGKIVDRTLGEVERLAGEVKGLFDRYDVDPAEIETLNALAEHLPGLRAEVRFRAYCGKSIAERVHDLEQLAMASSARIASVLYSESELPSDYEPTTFDEELERLAASDRSAPSPGSAAAA